MHGSLTPQRRWLATEAYINGYPLVMMGMTRRVFTPEDYSAVHALQDQVKLVPLSSYGKEYRPPWPPPGRFVLMMRLIGPTKATPPSSMAPGPSLRSKKAAN
jgi:hypothetical protein